MPCNRDDLYAGCFIHNDSKIHQNRKIIDIVEDRVWMIEPNKYITYKIPVEEVEAEFSLGRYKKGRIIIR